jgi:hypothetical protein
MICTTDWLNQIYFQSALSMQASLRNALPSAELGNLTFHCEHCRGFDSDCTCESGCAPLYGVSRCRVVHHGIVCNGCSSSSMQEQAGFIQGPRYRCQDCVDCDLCESCYQTSFEEHDQMHAFERIARAGAPPQSLSARAECCSSSMNKNRDLEDDNQIQEGGGENIPIAIAVPIETATACACPDQRL